jgi:hypothetical protein
MQLLLLCGCFADTLSVVSVEIFRVAARIVDGTRDLND